MIDYGDNETYRSGVPLGGLGCGKIELCRDGAFRNLTLHNNTDQPFSSVTNANPRETHCTKEYSPEGLRSAFFFAAVEDAGARVFKYAEQEGLKTLLDGEIDYQGRYPKVALEVKPFAGVKFTIEAFSPLVPVLGEPGDSALPAAIFRLRAENLEERPIRTCLGFSWPNVIGCGGYPQALLADMRDNTTQWEPGDPDAACPSFGKIRFSHKFPKVDRRLDGEYILMSPVLEGVEQSWTVGDWNAGFFGSLESNLTLGNSRGELGLGAAGAIAPGNTGALAGTFTLKPGEVREIPMVLAWYFPGRVANQKPGVVNPNYYAKAFDSAGAVARYALENLERLSSGTSEWQRRLTDSGLPEWLSHKLINNLFPMSSCSLYFDDGRFGINEAPTDMNGCMGTIDQRAASATAYAMLFPELARSELKQFADQQIDGEHPERYGEHWNTNSGVFGLPMDRLGAIKHEIGWDELEEGKYGHKVWCNLHWPDLTCVFVLQCYQYVSWTGDTNFLDYVYPKIKDALAFHKRLDQNGDGLADLWGPGSSTFDNDQFPYYGASTFVATLYLAALRAAMKLALFHGESEYLEELEADFEQAQATVERDLWREDLGYYVCWYDANAEKWKGGEREHADCSENSMLSQLAGVWFARMLDLGDILDPDRVRQALESLHERHVKPFPYCPPNEVRPDGTHSICWPYYAESYFAANAIYHGLGDAGMEMVHKFYKAAFEKYTASWDLPLVWAGDDNSLPRWGRWYMTNPSSWTILEAIVGVHYNGLEKSLIISPNIPEGWDGRKDVPVFHPLFRGQVTVDESGITLILDEIFARSGLAVVEVVVPAGNTLLSLNGKVVDGIPGGKDDKHRTLKTSMELQAGDQLHIQP